MKMLVFCLLLIVLGCLSSTDPSQTVSAETVVDKIERRPLQDEDSLKRHEYPTLGNDYLLAVTGQRDQYKGTFIHVSCATNTTINVLAPYVNMTETYHILSGTQMIPLDNRLMNGKNTLAKKGVHVTADTPISIYVIESYYLKLTAMDGYFALPIYVLSTEYVIVTDTSITQTMCQFVIASLEDKTMVNVTFKTNGTINISDTNYSSGDVFSLEMSRLDTFQVQHVYDLTGTFIQSNKPIAVFSGCICGNGPIGGTCQHQVEQIVPVSSLGQEYIAVPLFPTASYRYRIIAPFNNTIVSIQGQASTIERDTFLEKWSTEPTYIRASKPVMLIEYGQCTPGKRKNGSDPSMITIPAISTFSANVKFGLHRNLTGNNIQYYLHVTIKTDVVNNLMLDHKRLNLEGSYKVNTDIWGNYTILVTNITSGYHELYHPDTSVRYGAILYGTGPGTSIGLPLEYNTASSKPSVTFVPTGTQNIKLRIVIVHGQANGYEIMAVSDTSGSTYTEKGTFLRNEQTSVYNFTTTDLPGSCFSFRVVATTGSGQWTGYSEPVIEPHVCYESTVDFTVLYAAIGVPTSLLVISVLLNIYFIRKNRRIRMHNMEKLQHANPVPPEDETVIYDDISQVDNTETRYMLEHLHLQCILSGDKQNGYLTPIISGGHGVSDCFESL